MKSAYQKKDFYHGKNDKKLYGLSKGDDIYVSKESNIYYDNEVTGNRERLDGKKGKLRDHYGSSVDVVFDDGSRAVFPKAYINYTKTPEYKKNF